MGVCAWCGALALLILSIGNAGAGTAKPDFRRLSIQGAEVRWPSDASGRTRVRYGIAEHMHETADALNCGRVLPPATVTARAGLGALQFRRVVRGAFDRWEAVANIEFVEAQPGERAQIVIGEQADPAGRAYANISIGSPLGRGERAIANAQICLNPRLPWKLGYDGNLAVYDLLHTLTHEIGHALGLDHPGARGALMSFRYAETFAGLTEGDRAGARSIYGGPSLVQSPTVVSAPVTTPPAISANAGRSLN